MKIKNEKEVLQAFCDNDDELRPIRECALEHVQLMQWLKELRALKKLVKPEYLQKIRGLQKTWGKEWEENFNRLLCYDVTGPFRDRYK